jgi:beta-galactosidase
VIAPAFYWDFGQEQPGGPGGNAAIFSNCERLEIFIDGRQLASLQPDRKGFPHLAYPPFFCDLSGKSGTPELRVDGYIAGRLALSRSFSADRAKDHLFLSADDTTLVGDGIDATRVLFQVVDRHGAPRPFAGGEVRIEVSGPGAIIGDNPFGLAESGGAGAVWVRTLPGSSGRIVVSAVHSQFGTRSVEIMVYAV